MNAMTNVVDGTGRRGLDGYRLAARLLKTNDGPQTLHLATFGRAESERALLELDLSAKALSLILIIDPLP